MASRSPWGRRPGRRGRGHRPAHAARPWPSARKPLCRPTRQRDRSVPRRLVIDPAVLGIGRMVSLPPSASVDTTLRRRAGDDTSAVRRRPRIAPMDRRAPSAPSLATSSSVSLAEHEHRRGAEEMRGDDRRAPANRPLYADDGWDAGAGVGHGAVPPADSRQSCFVEKCPATLRPPTMEVPGNRIGGRHDDHRRERDRASRLQPDWRDQLSRNQHRAMQPRVLSDSEFRPSHRSSRRNL